MSISYALNHKFCEKLCYDSLNHGMSVQITINVCPEEYADSCCVCVCVYIYIYIYIHMCIYIYIYTHRQANINSHIYIYIHTYVVCCLFIWWLPRLAPAAFTPFTRASSISHSASLARCIRNNIHYDSSSGDSNSNSNNTSNSNSVLARRLFISTSLYTHLSPRLLCLSNVSKLSN